MSSVTDRSSPVVEVCHLKIRKKIRSQWEMLVLSRINTAQIIMTIKPIPSFNNLCVVNRLTTSLPGIHTLTRHKQQQCNRQLKKRTWFANMLHFCFQYLFRFCYYKRWEMTQQQTSGQNLCNWCDPQPFCAWCQGFQMYQCIIEKNTELQVGTIP